MNSSTEKNVNFRKRVYLRLMRVPKGRVITYGELAKAVGCSSPRAVGQILRNNFLAPLVPCHRVIRADLKIGGFQGFVEGEAVVRKRRLLSEEGVEFDRRGKLLERQRLFSADPEAGAKPVDVP